MAVNCNIKLSYQRAETNYRVIIFIEMYEMMVMKLHDVPLDLSMHVHVQVNKDLIDCLKWIFFFLKIGTRLYFFSKNYFGIKSHVQAADTVQ